ncbi:hypothetical protein ELS17_00090 [Natrinema altunense]|uniref:Uncharacterized protein n=1 Tax=Natrinema altunense TaxID=222984 RepID=A0A482Y2C8_9EURY|nr:hypothetical protein ELS17_00090 [Natrinema altunense]
MRSGFVRASRLYDVDSRTPITHPAHQAADTDVRRVLEDREVRADGGVDPSSSGGKRCDTCGLEKIGGRCLTRWCDDRHPIVDAVFGDHTDGGSR